MPLSLLQASALASLITLTLAAYWPGLSGPFLFDDFANLPALGEFGGVDDFDSLRIYLLSGIAGPTGRPISLLSFLIDDNAWPSDPSSFKRNNLLLHLLTGLLLLWATYRICLAQGRVVIQAGAIASLVAAVWLLHPYNVSTTLYVVQRMAILSALFSLFGIMLYIVGRTRLSDRPILGYLLMTTGVGLGSLLATASKENGAALAALILVLELTALRKTVSPAPSVIWRLFFLWFPTIGLLSYLAWIGLHEDHYYSRPFTVTERLLTESRVLCDYLYHWFNPWASTQGLFNEDYPISKGVLSPETTLPAIAFLTLLVIRSITQASRHPNWAFGFGFFLAGHLIESTTIPLEIYFEHRNYLPAMFLFLPIANAIADSPARYRLASVFALVLVLALASATRHLSLIWSDELRLAQYWAIKNPTSGRAQSVAASAFDKHGRPDIALDILSRALQKRPEDLHLRLHYLVEKCFTSGITANEFQQTLGPFRSVPFDFKSYPFFNSLFTVLPDSHCRGIGFAELHELVTALFKNPKAVDSGARRQLHHLNGYLYARQRMGSEALDEFHQSLTYRPDPSAGLLEVSLLASNGLHEEALKLLNTLTGLVVNSSESISRWGHLDYQAEVARLRRALEDDLRDESNLKSRLGK
ncbi:hypothetical protein [Methyloterricola oryzae]|uniref:hypothetical protein n=1 Tax=Methyloterricola oryzae TaxID=1495050 RepID=UPI00069B5CA8|nr:hypothetical protein [Methyloterricola oryzae]